MTRIVAIADLHGNLPTDLPEGDLLLIAGDLCPLDDHHPEAQQRWLEQRFYPWLEELPHSEIAWIAGNHDFVCEPADWAAGGRGHYLRDSGARLCGLSIHGFPWVPKLRMWAFYSPDEELAKRAAAIPEADVVLAHGPPLGFGDRLHSGGRAGTRGLLERIESSPPRLCVFGHIHEDHGVWRHGPTELANVAHVDELYRVRPGAAAVFELD